MNKELFCPVCREVENEPQPRFVLKSINPDVYEILNICSSCADSVAESLRG